MRVDSSMLPAEYNYTEAVHTFTLSARQRGYGAACAVVLTLNRGRAGKCKKFLPVLVHERVHVHMFARFAGPRVTEPRVRPCGPSALGGVGKMCWCVGTGDRSIAMWIFQTPVAGSLHDLIHGYVYSVTCYPVIFYKSNVSLPSLPSCLPFPCSSFLNLE